jgi:hypothetical protein
VVERDVVFVADADVGKITKPHIQGSPTLAIEALSHPHPAPTVLEPGATVTTPLLPGLEIDVAALLAEAG